MKLFETRYREALKAFACGEADRRTPGRFTMEFDIIVPYGLYRGWGEIDKSRKAHSRREKASVRRDFFLQNPAQIFRATVLHRGLKEVFRCLVCGRFLKTHSQVAARKHVARHFVPIASIKQHGVSEEDDYFGE